MLSAAGARFMDHPEGAGSYRADRVDFDRSVRLEFRGTQLSSDGGILVMRERDDALGLSDLTATALRDTRRDKNTATPPQRPLRANNPWQAVGFRRISPKPQRHLGNIGEYIMHFQAMP